MTNASPVTQACIELWHYDVHGYVQAKEEEAEGAWWWRRPSFMMKMTSSLLPRIRSTSGEFATFDVSLFQ